MSKARFLFACLGAAIAELSAHGLMESPPSRSWICGAITKPHEIDLGTAKYPACSTAFAINDLAAYNFMAVVTHTWGRSKVAPLPKHVCGFAGEFWKGAETPWDVPMDWPAQPVKAGTQAITWNVSWGPHFDDTKEFRYWITKADFVFSPAKALSWDDFEAEPFCVLEYDDKNPTANPKVSANKAAARFTTHCELPSRKGHHVVYGEWGRTEPTIERFHGCIDVAYEGAAGLSPKSGPKAGKVPRFGNLPVSPDLLGRRRR
jgi:chitin-binding protein